MEASYVPRVKAKAVAVLAVRHVKLGTEAAGFREGSIIYTHVNVFE